MDINEIFLTSADPSVDAFEQATLCKILEVKKHNHNKLLAALKKNRVEPVGQAYSQLIKLLSGESELEEEEATETELKTDGNTIL